MTPSPLRTQAHAFGALATVLPWYYSAGPAPL